MTLQVSAVAAVLGLLIGLAAGLALNAGADIAELLRRALCMGRDVSHVVVEGELVVQDFRPTRCHLAGAGPLDSLSRLGEASPMKTAFIGLGSMGGGAAQSALRAGLDVTGVDPSERARQAFGNRAVARGVDLDPGQQAVVVLTVNAAQAEAALYDPEGAAQRLAPGGVVICSATMAPADAKRLAAEAASRGLLYLDAPVSGGAAAAREGRMTVMASGSDAAFAAAKPVLDAIAGKVWSLGAEPGQGAAMKVVHQLLAGVHIAAAAEAMALALRSGLDPHTVYGVVTSAAGNSWMFGNRMAHVLAGDDTPLSAGDIFVKDLGLVEAMAREAALPVPLAAQALQLFVSQRALGHGGRDDAFVLRVWQALAGFALPGEEGGAEAKPPAG